MRTRRVAKLSRKIGKAAKLICVMVCFLLLASGCKAEEELSLRQQIEDNLKKTRSLESYTKLTLDYTIGQRIFFETETQCRTVTEPWLFDARSTWKSDILNMERNAERRFMGEKDGEKIVFYSYYKDNWQKNITSGNKVYQQYETLWQLEILAEALDSLKQGKSRMENETELLRFDGAAPAKLVEKVLLGDVCSEAFGNELCGRILSAAYAKTEDAETSGGSVNPVSLTLWVDMKRKLPARFEIDFSNAVRTALKESAEKDKDVVEACLKCQITSYDKVDEIKIPTWAANAPVM